MNSTMLRGLSLGVALAVARALFDAWQADPRGPEPIPGGPAGLAHSALMLAFVALLFRRHVPSLAVLRERTKAALRALLVGATVSGVFSALYAAVLLPSASMLDACLHGLAGIAVPLLVGSVLIAIAYGRKLPHALAGETGRS